MTWQEGTNQAGFSIVGLHKIHHDDIPQVLTEKLAQELRECAHNMHKDRFLRLDYIVICHIIKSSSIMPFSPQTFAMAVANVCDRGCKRYPEHRLFWLCRKNMGELPK